MQELFRHKQDRGISVALDVADHFPTWNGRKAPDLPVERTSPVS